MTAPMLKVVSILKRSTAGGNVVERVRNASESYRTIEDDRCCFIDEIPDFDQADGYFIFFSLDGDHGFQTRSGGGSLARYR